MAADEVSHMIHFLTARQIVSYPDSTLSRAKGSGEFGQNPWASAEEFPRANQIAE